VVREDQVAAATLHVEGVYPRASWLEAFDAAGLSARGDLDEWGRDVFVSRKR